MIFRAPGAPPGATPPAAIDIIRLPDEKSSGRFLSQKNPPKRTHPITSLKATLDDAIILTSNQENI